MSNFLFAHDSVKLVSISRDMRRNKANSIYSLKLWDVTKEINTIIARPWEPKQSVTLVHTSFPLCIHVYINGLVQERRNSSALAMELRLSCTNPSIWYIKCQSMSLFDVSAAVQLPLPDYLYSEPLMLYIFRLVSIWRYRIRHSNTWPKNNQVYQSM